MSILKKVAARPPKISFKVILASVEREVKIRVHFSIVKSILPLPLEPTYRQQYPYLMLEVE